MGWCWAKRHRQARGAPQRGVPWRSGMYAALCAAAGCVCGAHMPMGSQSALPESLRTYRVVVLEWECKVKCLYSS